jgi:glycosyltransferase involved in cell wall biosynthesis
MDQKSKKTKMKEILVDIYKVNDKFSGLGQFSMNYANALKNLSPDNFKITFLIPRNYQLENCKKCNFVKVNFQKRYLPGFNKSYDIWHSLHQFPSHFPSRKSKLILTVHDLNFLIEKNEEKKLKYLHKLQMNIDRADFITAISDYTKRTIENHINLNGKIVRTIYNGIADDVRGMGYKPDYVDDRKFFFSIGIFSEKKNFHVLLSIMKHFENFQLIIAGDCDSPYGDRMKKQIIERNLSDRVILPGKINDDEKFWLYDNCEAFLFPSLAEGFGMPVIEAMKFGKPVFLSRLTSLPEIGGEVAYYFDNFDEEYMSSLIDDKMNSFNRNKTLLSAGIIEHAARFSWKTCIEEYVKLYQEIVNIS